MQSSFLDRALYNMLDLDKIDELIDEEIDGVKLSKICIELSIWRYLTVAEDLTKISYIHEDCNFENIFFINYKMKFVYKFAIQKICREMLNIQTIKVNNKTDSKSYKEYSNLIRVCFGYVGKYNMLSNLYEESIYLNEKIDNNYSYEYNRSEYLCEYSALELLSHGKSIRDIFITIILSLYSVRKDTQFKSVVFEAYRERVTLRKRKVTYDFFDFDVYNFDSLFGKLSREGIFECDFNYKWGGTDFTRGVINSILFRCLFHVVMIWVAMRKYNFIGGFEDCLVLKINKNILIENIKFISGFENTDSITEILNFLVYPVEDVNADFALQPIFLFNDNFYLPCFHILESNMERNIISLYARKEKKRFDKESKVFEYHMVESIEKNIINKYRYEKNFKIRVLKKDQEYDFIIIDQDNKVIVIVELRWMIQPADPREISRRISACREKVDKVKEKKKFFLNGIEFFEERLDIKGLDEYELHGLIVLDGYGGEYSGNESIPITTLEVFNLSLANCKNLRLVYQSLKSLEWLPQENVFFESDRMNLDLNEYSFSIPGLRIIDRDTDKYVEYLNDFFRNYELAENYA